MMSLARKVVHALLFIALGASLLVWFWACGTVCSEPRILNAATDNIISYNCHGMTVYITPARKLIFDWLIPIFLVLMLARELVRHPRRIEDLSFWRKNAR